MVSISMQLQHKRKKNCIIPEKLEVLQQVNYLS